MALTLQRVRDILGGAGVPNPWAWQLLDRELEPVSVEKVDEIAEACLAALPPQLVKVIPLGGGKTRHVPLWVEEAGDCESHSFVLFAWIIVGNWSKAVIEKVKRGGMAAGPVLYTAIPRPENGHRAGRHAILWHIDHAEALRFYEFGDRQPTTLTPEEIASITMGFAA